MSFIRKTKDVPKLEIGQTLEASIVDIKYPVQNEKFGKENVELKCRLNNGYECRAWIGYSKEPFEKSTLATLLLSLMNATKRNLGSVDDGLNALKEYGKIYLRCYQPRSLHK